MHELQPGEAIGIIASHSIGQPTTQIALSSFHHAGSTATEIVQGLPRLEQIMNLSVVGGSCHIHLQPNNQRSVAHMATFQLKDLIDSYNIICDFDAWWYDLAEACDLYTRPNKQQDGSILRLVFDRSKMLYYSVSLRQICNLLGGWVGCAQPLEKVDESSANKHQINDNKRSWVEGVRSSTVFLRLLPSPENLGIIDVVYTGGHSLVNLRIRLFKLARDVILTYVFPGINLRNIVPQPDGSIIASCALLDILNQDGVDKARTLSYCIVDVYTTLGVEAARKCIVIELSKILHGNIVYNDKHVNLVADYMTHRGRLLPINSSGVSRVEEGTITRACYERTLKEIARACKFGSTEKVASISEHILIGTQAKIGTSFFSLAATNTKKQTNTK